MTSYLGIDVSKATLDAVLLREGQRSEAAQFLPSLLPLSRTRSETIPDPDACAAGGRESFFFALSNGSTNDLGEPGFTTPGASGFTTFLSANNRDDVPILVRIMLWIQLRNRYRLKGGKDAK